MTVTLVLEVAPPADAYEDTDVGSWTAGYVAGCVRGAGLVVVRCTTTPGGPETGTTPDSCDAALDVGPGLRDALARASEAMDSIDAHEADAPAGGDVLTEVVETARHERMTAEPIAKVPFDPDKARARAAGGSTGEVFG